MCFYIKVPKVHPDATETDSDSPILCANSLADMHLFKEVVMSQ